MNPWLRTPLLFLRLTVFFTVDQATGTWQICLSIAALRGWIFTKKQGLCEN